MQWTTVYTKKKRQNNDTRNFTSNTNNRLHYNRYAKCVSQGADNEKIPGSMYIQGQLLFLCGFPQSLHIAVIKQSTGNKVPVTQTAEHCHALPHQ